MTPLAYVPVIHGIQRQSWRMVFNGGWFVFNVHGWSINLFYCRNCSYGRRIWRQNYCTYKQVLGLDYTNIS